MATDRFVRLADELIELETRINSLGNETSVHLAEITGEELKRLWLKVIEEYNILMDTAELEGKDKIKEKYIECYDAYTAAATLLKVLAESVPVPAAAPRLSSTINVSAEDTLGFHTPLPPCDTEVFHGDYQSWPRFRELFKAIYINDPRVPPVRKLYYLSQKCRGEARDIVNKFPLSSNGFDLAWKSLSERYENKRVLVNSQLKVLLNLTAINAESGTAIKGLQRDINNVRAALSAYDIDIKNWDAIFVYICSTKLPEVTLSLWEQSLPDSTEIPTWETLNSFLTKRFQALETVSDMRGGLGRAVVARSTPSQPQRSNRLGTFHANVEDRSCLMCQNRSHVLKTCRKFRELSSAARLETVTRLQLCYVCLSAAHGGLDCKTSLRCYVCNEKHHTMLHQDGRSEMEVRAITPPETEQPSTSEAAHRGNINQVRAHFTTNSKDVLLGTAQVVIHHNGVDFEARALIDPGSEASFIAQRLQRVLKIPTHPISAQVSGLNDAQSGRVEKMCRVSIGSAQRKDFKCDVTCLVMPRLTGNLPSRTLPPTIDFDSIDIPLADERWMHSSQVDLLIGGDVYPQIMLEGIRKEVLGSLLAQETVFGWVLTGPIESEGNQQRKGVVSFFNEVALDNQLARFWELEEVPKKKFLTEEEAFCEQLYEKTTVRKEDGRYQVRLPFRPEADTTALNGSHSIARTIYLRNEQRLSKNKEFKAEYDKVLKEYIELGHMIEAPEGRPAGYYLPHHAVLKPESTTTKIRVVFNASSHTKGGASLNDVLFPGPTLQADLMKLLLKWRYYKFVFNGDIEKMYRQILVHPSDTPFQRILFRENEEERLKEYELQTVTFGVNCAPYLAIRTLLRLAQDVQGQLPLASEILRSNMYVDDALVGAHDIKAAIKARDELKAALKSAGLVMRKWTANSRELLDDLDKKDLLSENFLKFEDDSTAKTLGIRWNAQVDEFYFVAVPFTKKENYTKRQILSIIARLFDPAGWLAPIVVKAKILMQKVWLKKIDWDEKVAEDIGSEWQEFLREYDAINSIRIPRWVHFSPSVKVQFHAFSDASEKAYGACIYVRVEVEGRVLSNLLCGKSKVAPVRTVSLPRLELCGASLLAELVDGLDTLKIDRRKLYCWTDSTIVLAWLDKPPCMWKVFVANRIARINEVLCGATWYHVQSSDNPADLVSRGVPASALIENSLWWQGPAWLTGSEDQWPKSSELIDTDEERRPVRTYVVSIVPEEDIFKRFSSFTRGIRVMSFVLRFIEGSRKRARPSVTYIDSREFQETKKRMIRVTQLMSYREEYTALERKIPLPSKSSLLSLHPALDDSKIIRVGGRLRRAPTLSYDEQHPIILPYNSGLAQTLVQFSHLQTEHGGNDLMLRVLRSEYWIVKVKNLIRKTVRNCKTCVIHRKETSRQIMGELPPERLEVTRPFTSTGVDFAGPFDIKTFAGRGCKVTKGYVCVFICFSTKAIHLELTSDLSTGTFLEALARFISRRGCPRKIFSDNGTNFVGASRELRREFKQFMKAAKESCETKYAEKQIEWKFIPPGAPHMGGLWESGVKSFKKHFRRVVGETKLTYEEFSTVIARIESCLNSRPISSQSNDPDDLAPLTPGHFLIGGPLLSLTESEENHQTASLVNRWRRLKVLFQEVCRRWKAEYLAELQKRYKWKTAEDNLKLNDLVVIKQENLAPNEWRLGRIIDVHPGEDGMVRVATVKTSHGVTTRAISKLVVLPSH